MKKLVLLSCILLLSAGCAKKPVVDSNTPEAVGAAPAATVASPATAAAAPQQEPSSMESGLLTAPSAGLKKIYFDFDSFLLSPEARQNLDQNASWMKENPSSLVLIEGHTDERGSDAYNLALGERRARSAKEYLVGLGIRPERLSTVSYGEERPAVPGQGEEAWAQNRRDEFVPGKR